MWRKKKAISLLCIFIEAKSLQLKLILNSW